MKPRYFLRPLAEIDLAGQTAYLAQQSQTLARRFHAAAGSTIRQLAADSGLGGLEPIENSELAGLRVWQVSGFPNYLVFYRPIPEGIEVIRILHAAQDREGTF